MRSDRESLTGFIWTCALLGLAAVFASIVMWSSGCATVGKVAEVLAPHIPAAMEAVERFLGAQKTKTPAGSCEAVPEEFSEDADAVVAVCSPGTGWLKSAATVLSEAAESAGEPLDLAAAGCFPATGYIVCVAPYAEAE